MKHVSATAVVINIKGVKAAVFKLNAKAASAESSITPQFLSSAYLRR
jgi:hypothetical protein